MHATDPCFARSRRRRLPTLTACVALALAGSGVAAAGASAASITVAQACVVNADPAVGSPMTVAGTGFVGVTAVKIGDVVVKATVSSATSLHFVTPMHAAGTAKVLVAAAGGTNGISSANTFTFVSTTVRK